MSDLIERKAAIDAVYKCNDIFAGDMPVMVVKADAYKALAQLPSAQSERNKGSWNVIQGNIVVCSECGMCAPKIMTGCLLNRHLEPNRTNFCPNCGADMRGEQDDTE